MRLKYLGAGVLALSIALGSGVVAGPAIAADDKADADKASTETADADKGSSNEIVHRVFDNKHLEKVEAGKELVYKFKRSASNPELLGQEFSDDITLKVKAAKPDGGRDVDLQIYTGDRARDLQQMPDRLHNPVFLVYFNQAVNTFGMLSGGKPPYLTRLFSNGFKDKAKMEPVKVTYNGKEIDAYRIEMKPYLGDSSVPKMQGWENAEYVITMSDEVPGEVVDLRSIYTNKYDKKDLRLVERITLDGVSGLDEAK